MVVNEWLLNEWIGFIRAHSRSHTLKRSESDCNSVYYDSIHQRQQWNSHTKIQRRQFISNRDVGWVTDYHTDKQMALVLTHHLELLFQLDHELETIKKRMFRDFNWQYLPSLFNICSTCWIPSTQLALVVTELVTCVRKDPWLSGFSVRQTNWGITRYYLQLSCEWYRQGIIGIYRRMKTSFCFVASFIC